MWPLSGPVVQPAFPITICETVGMLPDVSVVTAAPLTDCAKSFALYAKASLQVWPVGHVPAAAFIASCNPPPFKTDEPTPVTSLALDRTKLIEFADDPLEADRIN